MVASLIVEGVTKQTAIMPMRTASLQSAFWLARLIWERPKADSKSALPQELEPRFAADFPELLETSS
jgi:hypothetical protein